MKTRKTILPAEQARLAAGFKRVEDVAQLLKCHPRTLRRIELHGSGAFDISHKLAQLYDCSPNLFLAPPELAPNSSGSDRGSQTPSRSGRDASGAAPASLSPRPLPPKPLPQRHRRRPRLEVL